MRVLTLPDTTKEGQTEERIGDRIMTEEMQMIGGTGMIELNENLMSKVCTLKTTNFRVRNLLPKCVQIYLAKLVEILRRFVTPENFSFGPYENSMHSSTVGA